MAQTATAARPCEACDAPELGRSGLIRLAGAHPWVRGSGPSVGVRGTCNVGVYCLPCRSPNDVRHAVILLRLPRSAALAVALV